MWVNLVVLELHVPQWTVEPCPARGLPDPLVFDLDPGDGATIVQCARVAQRLRAVLVADGLAPVATNSGSKDMQVYAGVRAEQPEPMSVYAKALAERLARETPGPGGVDDDQGVAGRPGIDRPESERSRQHHYGAYSLRDRALPTVLTRSPGTRSTAAAVSRRWCSPHPTSSTGSTDSVPWSRTWPRSAPSYHRGHATR
ncbi:hypothetical protein RM788_05205 [Umezawaea sp. Da 62-37]|nr:hypothetical protein [Umezawaea sp. Da 62-37]WNV87693.1 hypothetical protein RM788_05205 [Umezawaea sp. Da 62-37]